MPTRCEVEQSIYNVTHRQPEICQLGDELYQAASDFLSEIKALGDPSFFPLTPTLEMAKKTKMIWVLSGPGNMFSEWKEDDNPSYLHKPWTSWMDKKRLSYAAYISGAIAVQRQSFRQENSRDGDIAEKQAYLSSWGVPIYYNGRMQGENDKLREALRQEGIVLPESLVHIYDDPSIHNTIDQIRTFSPPRQIRFNPNDRILVVSHEAHLARFAHLLNNNPDVIPGDVQLQFCPLPTLVETNNAVELSQDYIDGELQGYLAYLSRGQAARQPFPYILPDVLPKL